MAAAFCIRSLLIYLVFDDYGLPNLGSVAKVIVRHGTPHCGPVDFTPKAPLRSRSEEHGRPHRAVPSSFECWLEVLGSKCFLRLS
jgi:hypothetical protein